MRGTHNIKDPVSNDTTLSEVYLYTTTTVALL